MITIERNNAEIELSSNPEDKKNDLIALNELLKEDKIVGLDFTGIDITDEDCEMEWYKTLGHCKNLKSVALVGSSSDLRSLNRLLLGLKPCPNLQSIGLFQSTSTELNNAFATLAEFLEPEKQLTELSIESSKIEGENFKFICDALKNIKRQITLKVHFQVTLSQENTALLYAVAEANPLIKIISSVRPKLYIQTASETYPSRNQKIINSKKGHLLQDAPKNDEATSSNSNLYLQIASGCLMLGGIAAVISAFALMNLISGGAFGLAFGLGSATCLLGLVGYGMFRSKPSDVAEPFISPNFVL
ncbi:MAG: hypothetical protein H0U73_03155 [Tatlockia sp.]|nr:hypothetical protein [Tatlockia sp.]